MLVATLAILLVNIANALEIIDVRTDYWAGQEIIRSIQNGYIEIVDGNKFNPEGTMTRSEFVNALLKVINRQNEEIVKRRKRLTRGFKLSLASILIVAIAIVVGVFFFDVYDAGAASFHNETSKEYWTTLPGFEHLMSPSPQRICDGDAEHRSYRRMY